MYQCIMIKNK